MEYNVFISYRREGAAELAQLLYTRLKDDGYDPFFDVEKMRSGRFNEQLYEVIEKCDDMILLLPEDALLPREGEDWVRLEVAHALKAKKNIVPVLMRGFKWPDILPEDINEVRYCHGVSANMEYFEAVYQKLKELLISKPSDLIKSEEGKKTHNKRMLAEYYLQNREFDEANLLFGEILSEDAEFGAAYLGRFMAENAICDKNAFRTFFKENIVYNDINIKLARKYADEELNQYFSTVSFPKCTFDVAVATCQCEGCGTLLCDDCIVKIDNQQTYETPPLYHKKNICENCFKKFENHVEKLYKKNRFRCVLQLIISCGIIAASACFAYGDIKSFFLNMGIMSGIFVVISYGFIGDIFDILFPEDKDSGCLSTIIILLIMLVISTVLAPLILATIIVSRIYWLITMQLALKSIDQEKDNKMRYIDMYYQVFKIAELLRIKEPDC